MYSQSTGCTNMNQIDNTDQWNHVIQKPLTALDFMIESCVVAMQHLLIKGNSQGTKHSLSVYLHNLLGKNLCYQFDSYLYNLMIVKTHETFSC